MNILPIGSLVVSEHFEGTGKIVSVNIDSNFATVAFFESPAQPYARQIEVNRDKLSLTIPPEEAVIYCLEPQSQRWARARFGGSRPNGDFLVIFREEEYATLPIDKIFVLNKAYDTPVNPADFLALQANDAPFFFPLRQSFIETYIQQRAACRAMASISSSAVELEPHQLAVVRRVLQDKNPKYILADEVGLGKTIEAGMVVREHALEATGHVSMLIAVPAPLVNQWREELGERFQLKQLIIDASTALAGLRQNEVTEGIVICTHCDACTLIERGFTPSLIAVDEVHQIASWPWSGDKDERYDFNLIAKGCRKAHYVLLLTGTPLHGHERNFLSMLHCINPEAYQVDETHLQDFTELVKNRENLGGIFSGLVPSVSNVSLRRNLETLQQQFPEDTVLMTLCQQLIPLIGTFSPNTQEREERIRDIRRHLGENYRIHHRLLRNRRQVSLSFDETKNLNLNLLFPGLNGAAECRWYCDGLALDELIDEYRSLSLLPQNTQWAMSEDTYLFWIDDLLSSPLCVMQRAKVHLGEAERTQEERDLLEHIVSTAKNELQAIDNKLAITLNEWLQKNSTGKAIVFCDRPDLAQHLAIKLELLLEYPLERYQPGQPLMYLKSGSPIRILICDKSGEDGLNLHGGLRLAVHYGLPRSCSRIEQRLGRLNRYSANLKGVKPVQSLILKNHADRGLRNVWASILKDSIGVFNNTIASLQFVLDDYLENAWQNVYQEGPVALERIASEFPGEQGILANETHKINMQEKLLAMDDEIAEAAIFAQQISADDHLAVAQCNALTSWITRALRFRATGTAEKGIKFQFELSDRSTGTLVDFKTFLTTCMLSFDKEGGNPPSTHLMSAERIPAIDGTTVYPLRYGQPFVDTIWQLLNQDARGSSMAVLRVLPKPLNEPNYFFQSTWLVTHRQTQDTYAQRRIADELYPPRIVQHWLSSKGTPVTNPQLLELLNSEYAKHETSQKFYADMNLRPNLWQEIEELVSPDTWKEMVERVYASDREQQQATFGEQARLQLMAVKAVVVCSRNLLEEIV
ncbi:protein DpdE [Citrobacter freundii]|uniref:protein DpdE n=1 Tax=Enterobacteriaceae TaxID=543 RepID=UPI0007E453E7|nr:MULTISPECIES: protein DpdE [Enterobacteriaceae]AUV24635.1 helicase SNF2 [Citrobacter freundii complex sp. CFNIH3]EKT9306694.1 helicase SNF2 [Citrobacter freundii]MDE8797115.1 protein DpdE [Citrobacter freundii]MDK2359808.1 protein DpdE [Citrobacter freundii]POV71262.1 helicase SNF2 [Citrobacter freundii complex sp. CFNIH5]